MIDAIISKNGRSDNVKQTNHIDIDMIIRSHRNFVKDHSHVLRTHKEEIMITGTQERKHI